MTKTLRSACVLASLLFVEAARADDAGTDAGKSLGSPCSSAADCAPVDGGIGYCVDGVCCNEPCQTQTTVIGVFACSYCNLAGPSPAVPGVCAYAPPGPPKGGRDCGPLPTGVSSICAKWACAGSGDRQCHLMLTGQTTCRPASCDGSKFIAASTCDKSSGACADVAPHDCYPYACATTGCRNSCTGEADCSGGAACNSGSCVVVETKCSSDNAASINKDGTRTECYPFTCGDSGRCWSNCSNSDQCAAGFNCDTQTSKCVATASSDSSGGCSTPTTPLARWSAAIALIGVAIVAYRRRASH